VKREIAKEPEGAKKHPIRLSFPINSGEEGAPANPLLGEVGRKSKQVEFGRKRRRTSPPTIALVASSEYLFPGATSRRRTL